MSIERPSFHESWYRVAALRPRVRTTVQTWRQHFRGRRWYVVQDAANNQHFRLDEAGYHFVALLDGRRTVEQAWQICNEQFGDHAPTQGEAIQVLGQLYTSNLLQSDLPADAAGMFESQRVRMQRQIRGVISNILFVRVPLFDPDAHLERWERLLGAVFCPIGVMIWSALIVLAGVALAGRADELLVGVGGVLAPDNLFLLYVGFAIVKAMHELGHAVATRRLGRLTGRGGEVHTIGITLLVMTPVPYVDASSAWAFRSKWHRAIVGAAGMYVEVGLAALAAIVWANTSPGAVHALAYNMMFVASVSTLLFNGNPLLRFDGYYILSDLLEVPNLSTRSRDRLAHLVKRYVFGIRRSTGPVVTEGERWGLPVYALAAAVYRVVICAGIIMFVADKLFIIGTLLALSAAVSWLVMPAARFVRYLLTSPDLARTRPRAIVTTSVVLAVLAVTLGLLPVPDRARAEGVVEPVDVAMVYAEVDGLVRDVLESGCNVDPDGAPLIVAGNVELSSRREQLSAERHLARLERDRAQVTEIAVAQSLTERIDALDRRIEQIDRRLGALTLRAPVSGRWIAPDIERLRGAYIKRGDPVGVVASDDRLLVRAVTDQRLGPRLGQGLGRDRTVEIRVLGRPDIHLRGEVREILPAGFLQLPSAALGYLAGGSTEVATDDESGTRTVEPFFEVHIELDEEAISELMSGQRVEVRFEMPARPMAVQGWRALRQLVQRRFQV